MLAAARVRWVASGNWVRKRYLNMERLIREDAPKTAG